MFRIRTLKRRPRGNKPPTPNKPSDSETESKPKAIKVKKRVINMSQNQESKKLKVKNSKVASPKVEEELKTCPDTGVHYSDKSFTNTEESLLNSSMSCKFLPHLKPNFHFQARVFT